MKLKIALVLIGSMVINLASFAKEVNLRCSGISETYSSRQNRITKSEDKFEMSFDDQTNQVLALSVRHAFGCHPKHRGPSATCECKVTESSVSCETTNNSEKDTSFKQTQSINVNRFTGIARLLSKADWMEDGKPIYLQESADLKCESFTQKKF